MYNKTIRNQMAKKKILQEIHTQKLDFDSGEVKQDFRQRTLQVEKEPDYVKFYLQDILRIKDLSKGSNAVLMALLRRMTYDNKIILIAAIKREISEELNVKIVTINKAIDSFLKADVIIRTDRGIYVLNPYLFGRGSWEDIRQIRLTIYYTAKGGRQLTTEIEGGYEALAS
jgi:predicted transcriptional regulator